MTAFAPACDAKIVADTLSAALRPFAKNGGDAIDAIEGCVRVISQIAKEYGKDRVYARRAALLSAIDTLQAEVEFLPR